MKSNTRQKALRTIVASILTSSLTADDIRSISSSIIQGDDFAWELGTLMQDIAKKLDKYSTNLMESNLYADKVSPILLDAIHIVKSKRLSKATILNFIGMIAPDDYLLTERRKTTNELLADFFNRRPAKDKSELLHLLQTGGRGGDEYLQGIIRKR